MLCVARRANTVCMPQAIGHGPAADAAVEGRRRGPSQARGPRRWGCIISHVSLHCMLVMALQSRKHNCVQVYIASPSRPTSYAAAFTIT